VPALHVFDGLARLALDALDQVGDFPSWTASIFSRQLADLIRNYGKSQPRARRRGARFDGGVQRQKVGLLRQVVDDFNNFSRCVVGAVAQKR